MRKSGCKMKIFFLKNCPSLLLSRWFCLIRKITLRTWVACIEISRCSIKIIEFIVALKLSCKILLQNMRVFPGRKKQIQHNSAKRTFALRRENYSHYIICRSVLNKPRIVKQLIAHALWVTFNFCLAQGPVTFQWYSNESRVLLLSHSPSLLVISVSILIIIYIYICSYKLQDFSCQARLCPHK